MCQKIKCEKCKKHTYAGCGNHLKALFGKISQGAICKCDHVKYENILKACD